MSKEQRKEDKTYKKGDNVYYYTHLKDIGKLVIREGYILKINKDGSYSVQTVDGVYLIESKEVFDRLLIDVYNR